MSEPEGELWEEAGSAGRMRRLAEQKANGERSQHVRLATPDEAINHPWRRGRRNAFTIYVDVPDVPDDEHPFLCSLPSSDLAEALVDTWNEAFT